MIFKTNQGFRVQRELNSLMCRSCTQATRELAMQVFDNFHRHLALKYFTYYRPE